MANPNRINWHSIFSLRSIFSTGIGVLFAVVGLQGFLVPNNFLDGGVTGISILLLGISKLHISLLLLIFNLPFVIIGFKKIGYTFGMQASIAIVLLSAGMFFIDINVFTEDKVLIALFGGFFIGLGIGFVIRGGGVIDGLEVVALHTEKKSAFTSAEIILTLNILIILGAAYRFGIETGMYSILVYYTAMKTTNYVVDGFEEYTALNIISGNAAAIRNVIVNDYGKGITVFKGERGYLPGFYDYKVHCDIIVTVVTRLEIHRIKNSIIKIDPEAFIFVNSIKEVNGGVFKEHNKEDVSTN
ncbi:YitT family protein [Gillisia sp. Q332]|uniref:YitT family protein n=1 Tax=Gillisia xinjiangensis TaxID=3384765 RepID=UPI003919BD3B